MKLIVKDLAKEYCGFSGFYDRLMCVASMGLYKGSIRFQALQNLNFGMGGGSEGEIMGIIGPNGAGKSTLLRIITGISSPLSGSVMFQGSLRSILELGVGFSSDLSGRENIYYNGRLWGYTGRQLLDATDEILDFAKLREFADWPLGTYSTGMQMRLAFALATFEKSDLLVIDEALAVGDASFQQRCIKRFQEFRKAGSLIIIVSHDLPLLQAISDRILVLDRGKQIFCGKPQEGISCYMDLIADSSRNENSAVHAFSSSEFEILLKDVHLQSRNHFYTSEIMYLEIRLHPQVKLDDITVGIHIHNSHGVAIFGVNSRQLLNRGLKIHQAILLRFELKLNLGPGKYSCGLSVHRGLSHAEDCYLWSDFVTDFEVEAALDCPFEGTSYLEPVLSVEEL